MYLTLARTGGVRFEPVPVVRYRQHAANMSRDPDRMLQATLAVLDRERPNVPDRYRARFTEGHRAWCAFYGEQMIQRLRADFRAGRIGVAQLQSVALLWCECRPLLLTHISRTLRRVAGGHPSSEIEPGRFPVRGPGTDHADRKPLGAPR